LTGETRSDGKKISEHWRRPENRLYHELSNAAGDSVKKSLSYHQADQYISLPPAWKTYGAFF
jgi:hypothetical protein